MIKFKSNIKTDIKDLPKPQFISERDIENKLNQIIVTIPIQDTDIWTHASGGMNLDILSFLGLRTNFNISKPFHITQFQFAVTGLINPVHVANFGFRLLKDNETIPRSPLPLSNALTYFRLSDAMGFIKIPLIPGVDITESENIIFNVFKQAPIFITISIIIDYYNIT